MVKNLIEVEKYLDQIDHCTRCGLCQAVCPVFEVVKSELSVARGKLALMKGVLSGSLPFSPLVARYMELCVGCSACQEACPSGVCTDEIFLAAKESIASQFGLSLPKKAIVSAFSSESALHFFSVLLNLYSITNASLLADMAPDSIPFINKLKLLNAQLNGKVSLKLGKLNISQKKPVYKLIYFPGCINKYVNPSVAHATLQILKINNCSVHVPGKLLCCGMPALNAGAKNIVIKLAKENITILHELNLENFDYIVVDCASCGSMLNYYTELFSNIPEYAEKSQLITNKIIDINALLAKLDIKIPETNIEMTVTYHDPCHLRRSQHIIEEPRHIIKSLPGVEFIEMLKSDTCCGAAGSFCITHSEVSNKISALKAENILSTNADVVLTSCPSCKIGLTQGLINCQTRKPIYHIVELISNLYKVKISK